MDAATAVATGLLATLFGAAAAAKLAGLPESLATRDHLEISASMWRSIGVLELAGAGGALLGLALRPVGFAATAGLVLLSAGAIATHVRAGDTPSKEVPAGVALMLAAAALMLQATTA